ncbi:MAG TPA: hypothetical protein DEF47_01500 [Herpetosiphon sp.]|uniref:EamA domain-containing protein n=1 Tax=Herpetosiphon aurantiacus (strain ATCC 23779 / DSM 785 / 114-95) TaxID=316274 RepID=A9B8A2_HERA2|nr:hypothetical protein [Herpetosiphon sp.]ABX06455.1 conserved hypothetical protein [Herpetosiphon aurantiacus DSM 785]HBW48561.1 hypothetical protein [Herpetosiphon sp.]
MMQTWWIIGAVLAMMLGNLIVRAGMVGVQLAHSSRLSTWQVLCYGMRRWQVWLGLLLLFVGVVAWISSVVWWRLELGYTLLGLSYVATIVFAWWFVGETLTLEKMFGAIIIVVGLLLIIRGSGF